MRTVARKATRLVLATFATIGLACSPDEHGDAGNPDADTSPSAAAVITFPLEGDTLASGPVAIQLSTESVEIRPAGDVTPNSGHHHLFLNRDIVSAGETIPAEDGIIHLGGGQMTHQYPALAPGDYTLIAVLGDFAHVRVGTVKTDTVHFHVRPVP